MLYPGCDPTIFGPATGQPKGEPMKSLFAAAVLAATLSGLGAASAMPMAPLGTGDSADVIQVAQGCGPGWARGPYGRCRPMYAPRPVYAPRPMYRAPVVVAPRRVCPPGFFWRAGRCFR
jgi:hypothetical protein